ncbi:hypothetical protein LCL99_04825 [Halomonas denitrificans]|uniref:hypothetical protein n=1 Tax=Halomonas denitrificans TaxID=370769 RepID=UPI001CD59197|nr:hypothetical protein [Halomonas denitrificans]MCA0973783.1 hypothetical protein [Halomonas denitrificans]
MPDFTPLHLARSGRSTDSTPPPQGRSTRLVLSCSLLACVLLASLSGCTTYSYDDGRKETVWGVPPVDEHKSEQERQREGVIYREPGVVPDN